jgi:CBS domain-containing protein
MEKTTVKHLMVPLSEYATVPMGASLYEAILALEKAQDLYDRSKYQHRAVLVLDGEGRFVGKLSQNAVIRALEHKDEQTDRIQDSAQFGFSERFIYRQRELLQRSGGILENIGNNARSLKVEDVMQTPTEGEYVEENTSLDTACHQLVSGSHLSLLVTNGKEIVGVLRMSDVFTAICRAMHEDETHSGDAAE